MAGVVDNNGVQWEHCTDCGKYVRLTNLGYMKPTKQFPYGKDLCLDCVGKLSQWHIQRIQPAQDWVKQYS